LFREGWFGIQCLEDITIDDFFNVNLDLMCISNPDGIFLKVNNEFENLLGYTKEEIEGKNFANFMYQEDIEATEKLSDDLELHRPVKQFVNRYICKDGSLRYIEWKAYQKDQYIFSSGRDITQQIIMQKELIEKNSQLTELTLQLQQTNDMLEKMSVIDKLTGLNNRRSFDERVRYEMEHSQRHKKPLSMFIYDLDRFKSVNDTFGHPVGDDVLSYYAKLFAMTVRQTDLTYRIGGEEFILLMPDTSLKEAQRIAERVRVTFEKNEHPIAGKVTASFGVAQRFETESFESWYEKIDKALYQAKNEGRNKVVAWENSQKPLVKIELNLGSELISGNVLIDQQHKEILEKTNMLFNQYYGEACCKTVEDDIDLLIADIAEHFDQEEAILQQMGYKELEVHKRVHQYLLESMKKLEDKYKIGELKETELFTFVLDEVILDHLKNEDAKFFPYLEK
jgi:diguanylate cyclase (GGDEF)-like protein/hemerythrin-like metal-binding protein/PAS domain S-box-containing protein